MSWGVHDYPEPPNEPPEPDCEWCGFPYKTDVFFIDGQAVCEKCFLEYIADLDLTDVAEALGINHDSADRYLSMKREEEYL